MKIDAVFTYKNNLVCGGTDWIADSISSPDAPVAICKRGLPLFIDQHLGQNVRPPNTDRPLRVTIEFCEHGRYMLRSLNIVDTNPCPNYAEPQRAFDIYWGLTQFIQSVEWRGPSYRFNLTFTYVDLAVKNGEWYVYYNGKVCMERANLTIASTLAHYLETGVPGGGEIGEIARNILDANAT